MRILVAALALSLNLSACGAPQDAEVPLSTVTGVTLAWDAPTTTTDGAPVVIAGYRVYHSTTSPVIPANSEVSDVGNQTTRVFSNLGAGDHYFTVTAYDLAGQESGFSDETTMRAP